MCVPHKEHKFILYILPEDDGHEVEWVIEYMFDPVKTETRMGEQIFLRKLGLMC